MSSCDRRIVNKALYNVVSARIKEPVVEIESSKKDLILLSRRYFFHVESPLFLGRTINNDPFSLYTKGLYILACDVLLHGGNIEPVDYQSPGTGAVIFFSLKCVSNDTCGVGGRIGKRRRGESNGSYQG